MTFICWTDTQDTYKQESRFWVRIPPPVDAVSDKPSCLFSGDMEVSSCSDSKTHSSSSESESTAEQESFNSEDLSSMFDNENIDIGDFTEAAAAEGGDDFV